MLMIGDLAKRTGTKVNTVRFYEQIGLLPEAPRTSAGRRTYSETDVIRLGFVRRTRQLGFSIDEIRTLLDLTRDGENDCDGVDQIAKRQLAEIDRKITDLKTLRAELAAVIASCAGGTVAQCSILEGFMRAK